MRALTLALALSLAVPAAAQTQATPTPPQTATDCTRAKLDTWNHAPKIQAAADMDICLADLRGQPSADGRVLVASTTLTDCAKVPADIMSESPTTQADMNVCLADLNLQPIPVDGGRGQISFGPAVAVSLFQIENGAVRPTDFGGAGPQVSFDFWRANDGNFRLHVALEVLLGAGTVNGVATTSLLPALTLGWGGFNHIPLFAVGFGPRCPLNGKSPVQFTAVGSAATVSALTTF